MDCFCVKRKVDWKFAASQLVFQGNHTEYPHTLDASEIWRRSPPWDGAEKPGNNHGIKTSLLTTGDRRISEPSTVYPTFRFGLRDLPMLPRLFRRGGNGGKVVPVLVGLVVLGHFFQRYQKVQQHENLFFKRYFAL